MNNDIDSALVRFAGVAPHAGLAGFEDRVMSAIASRPPSSGLAMGATLSAAAFAGVDRSHGGPMRRRPDNESFRPALLHKPAGGNVIDSHEDARRERGKLVGRAQIIALTNGCKV